MHFSCLTEDIIFNTNIALKAISQKTSLPILECIIIDATNEGIKLFTTDLQIGIETKYINADVLESGKIAVESKKFSEIIRKLSGERIELIADFEINTLIIKSDKSRLKIMMQNASDFPDFPEFKKNEEIIITQNDFKNMIKETIFSISQDESKPIFTGELIEINPDYINLVAVDGFRIAYKKSIVSNNCTSAKAIIPGKTLIEIGKILALSEGDEMSIFLSEKHVLFEIDENIIISRLLEGEFLKYEQSMKSDYKTKISLNKNEFIMCLERASLISRDSKKTPVYFDIENNNLNIYAKAEFGEINEDVDIDMEGDDLKISFNPKYLLDILKVIDDDMITMLFNSTYNPLIIKSNNDSLYYYLVLPLRF